MAMKYLIIATLCLFGHISYSQVYKMKAIDSRLEEYDKFGKDTSTRDWEQSGILVVVDLTNDKIKTYGKTPGDFDLIKLKNRYIDIQGNESAIFSAIDGEGKKCEIDLIAFKDKEATNYLNLVLKYPKMALILRLKKDE
jgi:hypothetical protein